MAWRLGINGISTIHFMNDKKHIDDLITRRETHVAELRQIGEEIRKSARKAAVAFIDLSDSTSLKEASEPEVWLGYVYKFIRSIERLIQQFGGTVVKRIGDEVMATFETVSQCEGFVGALAEDEVLRDYDFKTSADYGEVFFLKFGEHLEDDPYGPAVDRCARISKLPKAGVVICSSEYYEQLSELADRYVPFGPFKLPGIAEPQQVYVRRRHDTDDVDQYLKPLIAALNDRSMDRPHYHMVVRQFSAKDFDIPDSDIGRPFLLRELLNIPKLPLDLTEFLDELKKLKYDDEVSKYTGYLVEWEGVFKKADPSSSRRYLTVIVHSIGRESFGESVFLHMPVVMTDIVRSIDQGTRIRFRGIIMKIQSRDTLNLDYVDIELPETSSDG